MIFGQLKCESIGKQATGEKVFKQNKNYRETVANTPNEEIKLRDFNTHKAL